MDDNGPPLKKVRFDDTGNTVIDCPSTHANDVIELRWWKQGKLTEVSLFRPTFTNQFFGDDELIEVRLLRVFGRSAWLG